MGSSAIHLSVFYTRLACVHDHPAHLKPSTAPPLTCETQPAPRPSITLVVGKPYIKGPHSTRPGDTSSRQLWLINYGERTSTSPLALSYILSLVLPVTFGHTTACRNPALAFSAVINFAITRSAACSAVLRHSPLSWAAVVHWSALMPKSMRSSRKHPIHSFSCPLTQPARPHQFSEHHALRQSRILHARHKPREQDPPLA